MKIISWNVNGLRAIDKKGFNEWLAAESPDILGIQEIKSMAEQLPEHLLAPPGYHAFFHPAEKKGYSGTAIYSKIKPQNVTTGLGIPEFDQEGRLQQADFGDFVFFNIYFPNGKSSPERLQFKLDYYESALEHFNDLAAAGKKLLIAGDYNTAHHPIDLARPQENEDISGFLPIERAWMDKLVNCGFSDCFRLFHPEPDQYTWWSYRSGARQRNVGWRIDYFFCSPNIKAEIKDCYHLPAASGSDHCPVVLIMNDGR